MFRGWKWGHVRSSCQYWAEFVLEIRFLEDKWGPLVNSETSKAKQGPVGGKGRMTGFNSAKKTFLPIKASEACKGYLPGGELSLGVCKQGVSLSEGFQP